MVKPSSFITSSDYATLKNDDSTIATVVFPASVAIAGSGSRTETFDVTIGAKGAINRIQISSSKDSSKRYVTQTLAYTRTGTVGGFPTPYSILAFVSRTSATNLRCTVYVPNPSGSTLTTASGDETFVFYIDTFIPPFI